VHEYEKLLKQAPRNPEFLYLLGYAQQLQGQLSEARTNYEQARKIWPENAGLQRDLGRLYGEIGDFANARTAFEQSLTGEPNEPLTYLYLGEMLEKSGDLRSAVGSYLNAQNLAPLWDRPVYKLGMLYGKLERPGDGYYYLGKAFALQDEDDKAINNLERALKILGANSPRGQLVQEELNTLKKRKRYSMLGAIAARDNIFGRAGLTYLFSRLSRVSRKYSGSKPNKSQMLVNENSQSVSVSWTHSMAL
jgi:tetratricopeptide (TPR) repeat protein